VINGTVQLGEHVGIQIAASGFQQVRFRYAVLLCFPKAVISEMFRHLREGATTVGRTHRIIDEHPIGREQVDPALQIFPFGDRA